MRRVCVVTGTRAEYGLLRPVMIAVRKTPALRLQVVSAGMHLARRFGLTVRQIQVDGFRIDARVRMTPAEDTAYAYARSIGTGVAGMADAFARLRPDVVVVLGDRVEAFAAAAAAAAMNVPVAHIHGGDLTQGGFDESMRHAITKLAHLHFPATATSARRLIGLGERRESILVAGAPGLDAILQTPVLTRAAIGRRLGWTLPDRFAVILQHAVSTDERAAGTQIVETLEGVKASGLPAIALYPNADPGGRRIIALLERYARQSWLRAVDSLPHDVYVNLLRHATVLVGNSSSGIIEAPSFKLPAVNVGTRQAGRERAVNVIDVPHARGRIGAAIREAQDGRAFRRRLARCTNPYGDGRAGARIAARLVRVPLTPSRLQKQLTY